MMRIEVRQTDCAWVLEVEGQIEGPSANALEICWRKLDCPPCQVIVDVSDVIHIDRRARSVLRAMHQNGVRFIGARLAIQDILEEAGALDIVGDNDG